MEPNDARRLTTRLQIIHAALMASLLLYVVVAWLAVGRGENPPQTVPAPMLAILAALAAAQLAGGPAVRRLLLKKLDGGGEALTGRDRETGVQRAYVVGAAVTEGAVVVGLMLTFVSGRIGWVVAFAAAAAASILGSWPSEAKVRSALGDPTTPVAP